MRDKLNFVIIMTDQQPQSHAGCYGNPVVKTPNLDRLAATGMRFDRAYTASPLCSPARAAMMTGLRPERAGAWANDIPLHAGTLTLGQRFRQAGYRTVHTGKWHLDACGYWGSGRCPEGWEAKYWYDGQCYIDDLGDEGWEEYRRLKGNSWAILDADVPDDFCWGKRVADRAVQFLSDVGESEPFVLVVSFDEPHPPVVCPAADARLYADVEVPLPGTLNEDLSDKPEVHRESSAWHRETYDLGSRTLPDGIRLWYAATSFVDAQAGRILDVIDRRFSDNTVVIFTTDHGDQLGAHGLCGKGPAMYEESVKVPFLARVPGVTPAGSITPALASTLDLLPTLCDLAGIAPGECFDGISLRPVLVDPGACAREQVVIGYNRPDLGRDALGGFWPARAIVDDRYKLIVNLLDRDELYDLQNDPLEQVNRIDDEDLAGPRDALHDRLMEEMARAGDFLTGKAMRCRPWRRDSGYHFSGA